jgi:hypothetical protein
MLVYTGGLVVWRPLNKIQFMYFMCLQACFWIEFTPFHNIEIKFFAIKTPCVQCLLPVPKTHYENYMRNHLII